MGGGGGGGGGVRLLNGIAHCAIVGGGGGRLYLPVINRARLTACKVGVFLREISQLPKIRPPPFLRSHLSSIVHGRIFERLRACIS